LEQLVREGNSVSEMAVKLGVTSSAVSKRLKTLNVAITKNVTIHHAGEIVMKNIDTLGQLIKINDNANELLDRLMADEPEEEDEEEELLSSYMGEIFQKKKRKRRKEKPDLIIKDRYDLIFRAMMEIRSQLKLQVEILNSFYNIAAMSEFQAEVLEAIGSVSSDQRDQIIEKLQKARALRSTIDFRYNQ
jgi:predicted transcriptional regulator